MIPDNLVPDFEVGPKERHDLQTLDALKRLFQQANPEEEYLHLFPGFLRAAGAGDLLSRYRVSRDGLVSKIKGKGVPPPPQGPPSAPPNALPQVLSLERDFLQFMAEEGDLPRLVERTQSGQIRVIEPDGSVSPFDPEEFLPQQAKVPTSPGQARQPRPQRSSGR